MSSVSVEAYMSIKEQLSLSNSRMQELLTSNTNMQSQISILQVWFFFIFFILFLCIDFCADFHWNAVPAVHCCEFIVLIGKLLFLPKNQNYEFKKANFDLFWPNMSFKSKIWTSFLPNIRILTNLTSEKPTFNKFWPFNYNFN